MLYVWLVRPSATSRPPKNGRAKTAKTGNRIGKTKTPNWHFIGKDNIVFHCVIFPILLKEHGGYILPTNVPANEFMVENDKISTSRNWAVWLHEYLEEFPGKQDELRYVLYAIMPEQRDGEFT